MKDEPRMAVVDVRSHPHPPFWRRGIVASPLLFDSPASSQLGRVPLGFASPPHDGFALLASAHGYACLLAHFQCLLSMHHTLNPRATQYLSDKFGHTVAVLSKRSEGPAGASARRPAGVLEYARRRCGFRPCSRGYGGRLLRGRRSARPCKSSPSSTSGSRSGAGGRRGGL
jgi:hypothetical protein